jgi:hypothetical protein
MLCAPAGIVEDIKFTLYDTGRWTFLDEKEEFVPRLLTASYEVRLFPLARITISAISVIDPPSSPALPIIHDRFN